MAAPVVNALTAIPVFARDAMAAGPVLVAAILFAAFAAGLFTVAALP